jgi:hypothetical protein
MKNGDEFDGLWKNNCESDGIYKNAETGEIYRDIYENGNIIQHIKIENSEIEK